MAWSRNVVFVLTLLAKGSSFGAAAPNWQDKVQPSILAGASAGSVPFIIYMQEKADLSGAVNLRTKAERGYWVYDQLHRVADRSQHEILAILDAQEIAYQRFWAANMILAGGSLDLVKSLASREDVRGIYANPTVHFAEPVDSTESGNAPNTIQWNVIQVTAPDVWAQGFTGQGVVVGGEDTGYQWDHPALINHYRGWDGSMATHDYAWWDAIHDPAPGNPCGADSPFPCDDYGHGTHTMGTMIGDDGFGVQIGVAPGATWIGCRNMDRGNGTPARYTECFQWFIAPTDLTGQNPDPTMAPFVINNSWGCPPSEGCIDPNVLRDVVEATRAAGIVVVVSAGNSGPSCSTVIDPAAIYEASFSVGATNSSDTIAGFSSRGPVTIDGSNRLKPDISAPGVSVLSSVPRNSYGVLSGTSMAGPHVVGVVALILSAAPQLIGLPDDIQNLLEATAVPETTTQTCGGIGGDQIPNNTYGWGRVDAFSAYSALQ
jgi:subtilisin family serine protease